jgi:hypothetical protein
MTPAWPLMIIRPRHGPPDYPAEAGNVGLHLDVERGIVAGWRFRGRRRSGSSQMREVPPSQGTGMGFEPPAFQGFAPVDAPDDI